MKSSNLWRLSAAILVSGLLGGCANTPQMRTLAGEIGSYAESQRAANLDAKRRYEDLNVDIERERSDADESAAAARRRTTEIIRAAKISQPKAVLTVDAATPEAIVAALKPVTVASIPPLDAGDAAAKLEAATKATAQMAVKPARLGQVKEVVGIYQEIQTQLDTLQTQAAGATGGAKTQAAGEGI